MRIVVKNIKDLQEAQVQEILQKWVPVSTDPACYLTSSGSYYVNVTSEALKTLAAEFNSQIKPQLGANSCIQIAAVQELPKPLKSKKLAGGIKNDETFNNYLKNPDTWRLDQVKKKKKKQKKANNTRNAQQSSTAIDTAGDNAVIASGKPTEDVRKKKKKPKEKPKIESKSKEKGEVKAQHIAASSKPAETQPKQSKPETTNKPRSKPNRKKKAKDPKKPSRSDTSTAPICEKS